MKNETTKNLNEPSVYILLSLLQSPLSGYEITRVVMEITSGRLEIKTGTMYPTLKRLSDNGYIKMIDVDKVERNKKIYEITNKGKEAVEGEVNALKNKLLEIQTAITSS